MAQLGPVATYKKVMNRIDSYTPLGYSLAGVVVAVRRGADDFKVGQRVAELALVVVGDALAVVVVAALRQPAGASATSCRPETHRAKHSARPPSPQARATPAPDPRRAAAATPRSACARPTSAGAALALARLRQRVGRAPPGQRPVSSCPSSPPPCQRPLGTRRCLIEL
jgi:NADPH:quinone reductase-like Zn-dependent oxidoreductase